MPSRSAQRRTTRTTTSVVKAGDVEVVDAGGNGHKLKLKVDLDMDAVLAEAGLTPKASNEFFNMGMFGEVFRVRKQINLLAMILVDEDDPRSTADSIKSILDMIHEDDRGRFRTVIASHASLDSRAIDKLVGEMIKKAAEPNPTRSSRGSGSTSRRTTSKQLSAAS
jgi:hypothetical protein